MKCHQHKLLPGITTKHTFMQLTAQTLTSGQLATIYLKPTIMIVPNYSAKIKHLSMKKFLTQSELFNLWVS